MEGCAEAGRARVLEGTRVLITAGPTHEAIDPVRYIANASSGKMGYAIARAARDAGAHVVLVSGPVDIPHPKGVELVEVVSAAEMLEACERAFGEVDAAILAAAVADFTPAHPKAKKIKKDEGGLMVLELKETADILQTLSAEKGERVVIGFAAETNDLIAHAEEKLAGKGCDLIVANDVSRADSTFGSDTDKVTFVSSSGIVELPLLPKDEVARLLVEKLAEMLAG